MKVAAIIALLVGITGIVLFIDKVIKDQAAERASAERALEIAANPPADTIIGTHYSLGAAPIAPLGDDTDLNLAIGIGTQEGRRYGPGPVIGTGEPKNNVIKKAKNPNDTIPVIRLSTFAVYCEKCGITHIVSFSEDPGVIQLCPHIRYGRDFVPPPTDTTSQQ